MQVGGLRTPPPRLSCGLISMLSSRFAGGSIRRVIASPGLWTYPPGRVLTEYLRRKGRNGIVFLPFPLAPALLLANPVQSRSSTIRSAFCQGSRSPKGNAPDWSSIDITGNVFAHPWRQVDLLTHPRKLHLASTKAEVCSIEASMLQVRSFQSKQWRAFRRGLDTKHLSTIFGGFSVGDCVFVCRHASGDRVGSSG